jgi:phosphate transport system ATP-binding protein
MIADEYILSTNNLNVYYGTFQALTDVTLKIKPHIVTALIGPSGCGKSTLLRCFNRMNDLIPIFSLRGSIRYKNQELYNQDTDATPVRSQIGMVFQKPNPFPKSIYENLAFGLRINGYTGNYDEAIENSLRRSALWDEVKDRLNKSAIGLSGGQQQRLCIARALAVNP